MRGGSSSASTSLCRSSARFPGTVEIERGKRITLGYSGIANSGRGSAVSGCLSIGNENPSNELRRKRSRITGSWVTEIASSAEKSNSIAPSASPLLPPRRTRCCCNRETTSLRQLESSAAVCVFSAKEPCRNCGCSKAAAESGMLVRLWVHGDSLPQMGQVIGRIVSFARSREMSHVDFAFPKLAVLPCPVRFFLRHAFPIYICYHSGCALSSVSAHPASDEPGAEQCPGAD